MKKRLVRPLIYVGFGILSMAIAWTFYDISGLNLVKVGVGGIAFMLLVDYVL